MEDEPMMVKNDWVIITETFVEDMLKGDISLESLQTSFAGAKARVLEKTQLPLSIEKYTEILFEQFGQLSADKKSQLFAVLATNALKTETRS